MDNLRHKKGCFTGWIQLNDQILKLKRQLALAHEVKERAIFRAQMTKSGHVYIISNMGSFGENRYKTSMTRRLDPMDRVKELGDASVPFEFDVHAIIYSDNAPELENILHKAFNKKRINMINNRKEFFDVSLEEIEKVIKENANAEIQFTKMAEAREYRETLAMLQRLTQEMNEKGKEKAASYPDVLF